MYKVLIVDDEELLRERICTLVQKHEGLKLAGSAQNGLDALDKIRVFAPDLVISDVVMPGMDGIELAQVCAEKYPRTAFIFLSGHQEFEYAKKAMQCGVQDYILKPVLAEELFAAINKVLDKLDDQEGKAPETSAEEPHYGQLVESLLEHTENNLEDPELSLKWVCQTLLFVNETHAGRIFTRETGKKYSNYVSERRIQKAMNLIRSDPSLNIHFLAEQVGFGANYRYFIEVFKKQLGCTPKQYQKQFRRGGL